MHGLPRAETYLVLNKQEEHAALQREREALRSRTDALQMTLMQTQGQGGLAQESSPVAILQKVSCFALVRVIEVEGRVPKPALWAAKVFFLCGQG